MKKYLLIAKAILVFFCGCKNRNSECTNMFLIDNFSSDHVSIYFPTNWSKVDTTYIVEKGLINSRSYYSEDSTEFGLTALYDHFSTPVALNRLKVIENNKAFLASYPRSKGVLVQQSRSLLNKHQIEYLQIGFFDSLRKLHSCVCVIIIFINEQRYIELLIKTASSDPDEAKKRMECIRKSIGSNRHTVTTPYLKTEWIS